MLAAGITASTAWPPRSPWPTARRGSCGPTHGPTPITYARVILRAIAERQLLVRPGSDKVE
jgi:hypothetical protein